MSDNSESPDTSEPTITSAADLKQALVDKIVKGTVEESGVVTDALTNRIRKQQGKPELK